VLKPASISFLIIICTFPVFGQVRVVDISEIGKFHYPVQILADVEGKVLVEDTNFAHLPIEKSREDIELFPGFPVSVPGQNERGGTYCNLDDDPEFELVYPAGAAVFAINIDGSSLAGWPETLDFPTDGAAAFGDIDGDGDGELVVTTHQTGSFAFGSIYAFERDGSDVNGFPVATEGGGVRSPALADLDGDDALEIIITVRAWPEGFVYVFNGAGDLFPNFPVRMDYVPASAAAVGDINSDGIPEIVTESYYGLHAFTTQGTIVDGFPYLPGLSRVFSYSTPVLADLDSDGMLEIICGDHSIENGSGAVHVVNYLGQPLDGWPKITGSWVFSPPSVGDINGDGLLDIVVGDEILSANPVNKVYAWTGSTADTLEGFPIIDQFGINSQIILADLDGDNNIELMFDDNTSIGNYHGYNHDGTIMEGWPLPVNGSTFYINPMVMDINLDGILDISGAGYDDASGNLNIYLWNTGVVFDKDLAILPILQYNTRHTGVYGDTFMVGVEELGGWEAWGHGGMEAGRQGGVVVFPNPGMDHISIIVEKVTSDRDISVSIYNSSGTLFLTKEYENDGREIKLNLEGYPSGVYWMTVKSNSSPAKAIKFIVL
jgi:hypothetical protein